MFLPEARTWSRPPECAAERRASGFRREGRPKADREAMRKHPRRCRVSGATWIVTFSPNFDVSYCKKETIYDKIRINAKQQNRRLNMTNEACRIICAAIIGGSIVLSSLIIGLCFGNKERYNFKQTKNNSYVFDSRTGRLYHPRFNAEKQKTEFTVLDWVRGGKGVLNP